MASRAPSRRSRSNAPTARGDLLRTPPTALGIRLVCGRTGKDAEEAVWAAARDAEVPVIDFRLSLTHPEQFATRDHVPKRLQAIEELESAGPGVILIAIDTLELRRPIDQATMVRGLATFLLRFHPPQSRVILTGSAAAVRAFRTHLPAGVGANLEITSLPGAIPAPVRSR